MTSGSHSIGIIAESLADIHALRGVALEAGLRIGSTLEFSQWNPSQPFKDGVDAWVINLDVEKLEAQCPEKIDTLMDTVTGTVILCDGRSPPTLVEPSFPSWKRRMLEKFHGIAGDIALTKGDAGPPACVWVLAGSLGGPESIHRFLEALPPDLGIAFIYANHLQKDFEWVLAEAATRNTNYPAYVAKHGVVLAVNQVAVISPECVTTLMPNGTFNVSKQRWQGVYQPNLDHVVSNVAQTFGHTGGAIVFSGMCDDGAAGCRIMSRNGGRVWIQQQDTCVCSAMPDAVLATGCAEKLGSPEVLANELVFWAQERKKQARARAAR